MTSKLIPLQVLKGFSSYVAAIKGEKPTREAYFFMHGFPANRSGKNLDLAEAVNGAFGIDAYLIHYRGLGNHPGAFSFSSSINKATKVASEILNYGNYEKLHIFGHSWGSVVAGQVALSLKEKIKTLILACPLTKIEIGNPVLVGLIDETKKEMPGVFGASSIEEVKQDLYELETRAQLWDTAPLLSELTRVVVIQALIDQYTPPEKTKLLLKRFKKMPKYVELNLDHGFVEDRKLLADTICKYGL
jgi:pimeloyl-ACP methyl ester carboxylesterase